MTYTQPCKILHPQTFKLLSLILGFGLTSLIPSLQNVATAQAYLPSSQNERTYTEPGEYDYQKPRTYQNQNPPSYGSQDNRQNAQPSYNQRSYNQGQRSTNTPSYGSSNTPNGNSANGDRYYGIPAQNGTSRQGSNNDSGYKPPANQDYNAPNYNQDRDRQQDRNYTRPDQGRAQYNNKDYNQARPSYRDNQQPFKQPRLAEGYSESEIKSAGHRFFGNVTTGLAKVIAKAFRRNGRPNGYILGEEGGGAFIAGLRYGEGKLYTKSLGQHPIFWQGPSVGYDFGASGSKTMTLIYNLQNIDFIYQKFGGVSGSAYVVGGIGLTLMKRDDVTLAPIRSGVGVRLGANIGYLKFTRKPTWNPF